MSPNTHPGTAANSYEHFRAAIAKSVRHFGGMEHGAYPAIFGGRQLCWGYSGLRASALSKDDRDYAQQTLRILSGLYGILRPYDGVCPYRLEMGYKLPSQPFSNLYAYWGSSIAETFPKEGLIVNLSAVEYTRAVMPYLDVSRVVAPRFLTIHSKTGEPSQVIVHTKIARGAFARWLIVSRITSLNEMVQFNDLNYDYNAALSTPSEPVFVCKTFGGIGLSVRLQKA
jgi:cytoplasmic iron level regulating protein YaaA (DUF328/UPF0246 family)